VDELWLDIRYALRTLKRSPGFAAVAVITLALGIGANTAMFSVVKAILIEPLQYKDSARLVVLNHYYPKLDIRANASAPGYVHYRDNNHSFDKMTALTAWDANLTGHGEPELLRGLATSANFFETLGVLPALGRVFTTDEDRPGNDQVVVLSQGLWQRRFGADRNVLNTQVTLNGKSYTVVGVMPSGFRFGRELGNETEIFSPIAFTSEQLRPQRWLNESLEVFARLKPGITIEQAQSDMDAMVNGLSQQFPNGAPFRLSLRNLQDDVVGGIRPALLVLLGAVGFVLLIACANVANLLLARASTREREIAIRAAVGGRRWRIVRQFLTESAILALLGGMAGLILAVWTLDALSLLGQAGIPRAGEIEIDRGVLLFTVVMSLATGFIFGVYPALRMSKCDLQETLKETVRSTGRSRGFQNVLIVSQIAIAFVVLIGAGLMIGSFRQVQHVNPGFDPDRLLVLQVSLPSFRFQQDQQIRTFFENALAQIRLRPGVESADVVSALPLGDRHNSGSFSIVGRQLVPGEPEPHGDRWRAGEDYFKTMRIPLLSGRVFTESDTANTAPVVVVDETLVRKYFPNEEPVGKRISFPVGFQAGAPRTVVCEIVGVVGHVKHWSIEVENPAQYYVSQRQLPVNSVFIVVRTAGVPSEFAGPVRAAIRNVDPDLPVFRVMDMEAVVANSMVQRRLSTLLLSVFAFIALLLAIVGLYGLMSYSVAQRTREIGIRMAIGAMQLNVLRMILLQGMFLVTIGIAIGLAGAFAATRLMATLLFGVSATDPLTFIAVAVVFIICALAALLVPARRATLVDPIVALRYE
jgi:putative ABC transport system permease protein